LKLPRLREFDEAAALEATMRGFGAGGFAATSERDLGDAMGLGQASVYNAFGGKRALFTQCLDRYLDANMRARIARVEQSLPLRQAIETFLAGIVERSLESRLGCLLANAALEVAPHDPEIAAVAAAAYRPASIWRMSGAFCLPRWWGCPFSRAAFQIGRCSKALPGRRSAYLASPFGGESRPSARK
jgi:AcrR family transcriptional regulator